MKITLTALMIGNLQTRCENIPACGTTAKKFKTSNTKKVIAWQEIAKTFKAGGESTQLQYKV